MNNSGIIKIDYTIRNISIEEKHFIFGTEFGINLLAGDALDRYYQIEDRTLHDSRLISKGEELNVKKLSLIDEWTGIEVNFILDKPSNIWRFPLLTVSQAADGIEKVYQGSVIFPHWRLELPANSEWNCRINWEIREI